MSLIWIEPDWPAPPGIRAASTCRAGGVSEGPYAALNLAAHVGDEPVHVLANRERLAAALDLPAEPLWLNQVHGTRTVLAAAPEQNEDTTTSGETSRASSRLKSSASPPSADAACARLPGVVCAVMTADCLPILLCAHDGSAVAAVHAGWKGLAGGVVESAVAAMGTRQLLAWLGPAIGPEVFEIGGEVRAAFLRNGPEFADGFRAAAGGKWLADIYRLARIALSRLGVTDCHGGGWCTLSQTADFFSYRRDGATGRMATLIWRESPAR